MPAHEAKSLPAMVSTSLLKLPPLLTPERRKRSLSYLVVFSLDYNLRLSYILTLKRVLINNAITRR